MVYHLFLYNANVFLFLFFFFSSFDTDSYTINLQANKSGILRSCDYLQPIR